MITKTWPYFLCDIRHLFDNKGRRAHLTGQVAKALKEKASDLFSKPPQLKNHILAAQTA